MKKTCRAVATGRQSPAYQLQGTGFTHHSLFLSGVLSHQLRIQPHTSCHVTAVQKGLPCSPCSVYKPPTTCWAPLRYVASLRSRRLHSGRAKHTHTHTYRYIQAVSKQTKQIYTPAPPLWPPPSSEPVRTATQAWGKKSHTCLPKQMTWLVALALTCLNVVERNFFILVLPSKTPRNDLTK